GSAPFIRQDRGLSVGLLAGLALELLGLALDLHLLVVDDGADAVLHLASNLFDRALDALVCLRVLLANLALELLPAAFDFHLLVPDRTTDVLLDLPAELLGGAFGAIGFVFVGHYPSPSRVVVVLLSCA